MLSIKEEMAAFDSKDREFYNRLTNEEKKKFSTYLMIRWGSSVAGSPDLQQYYLTATNLRLNKNFFAIPKKHDLLNWLAATTVSPNMGNMRHDWIAGPKKDGNTSKLSKFIYKVYPHLDDDDVKLLIELNDIKAWKQLAKDLGYTPEQIKQELG